MANTLLTNQIITFEALDILENTYNVMININSEYSDEFRFGGAVLGQTLNIRKPARYLGRLGQAAQIEAITETFVPLTLSYQRGVDTQVSSQQLTLDIDDYRRRVLEPQIVRLSNLIDQDCCGLAQGLDQSVGVPGIVPTTLATFLAAKTRLDNRAAPMDGDRCLFLNPAMEASMVDNLKGLFQSSTQIKEQYEEAQMGRTIGFDWYMDQNMFVMTVGTLAAGATPTVTTSPSSGTTTIVSGGWGASTLNAGDIVSFISASTPVNYVNPQSYQTTGQSAQFAVATQTVAAGGVINIPLLTPMIGPGSQLQNVTNMPAAGTPIYLYDTAPADFATISGKQSPQGMAVHKDFGTLAMVDLPLPGGTDKAYRAASRKAGKSLRVIRDYVAISDQWIQRLDVLYGVAVLRQELGVRICG